MGKSEEYKKHQKENQANIDASIAARPEVSIKPSEGIKPTGGLSPSAGITPTGGLTPSEGITPTGGLKVSEGIRETGGLTPSEGMDVTSQASAPSDTVIQNDFSNETYSSPPILTGGETISHNRRTRRKNKITQSQSVNSLFSETNNPADFFQRDGLHSESFIVVINGEPHIRRFLNG